jgi:hypothetical protein
MLISSRAILRVAASAAARWLQERRRQAQRLWLPQQVAGLCFSLPPLVRQWRVWAW